MIQGLCVDDQLVDMASIKKFTYFDAFAWCASMTPISLRTQQRPFTILRMDPLP